MSAEEEIDKKPLIVATVVLLAFVIGLHAFAYFMTCLDCDGMWQNISLDISKGEPTNTTNEYRFNVLGVSKQRGLSEFEIMVYDSTSETMALRAKYLDELKTSCASESGLVLSFYDTEDDDVLNEGDFFILLVPNNVSNYQIMIIRGGEIIFSDGSSINPSQDSSKTDGHEDGTRPSNLLGSRPGLGCS